MNKIVRIKTSSFYFIMGTLFIRENFVKKSALNNLEGILPLAPLASDGPSS